MNNLTLNKITDFTADEIREKQVNRLVIYRILLIVILFGLYFACYCGIFYPELIIPNCENLLYNCYNKSSEIACLKYYNRCSSLGKYPLAPFPFFDKSYKLNC
jgi:hypothetical protein